jgi:hypothetical protein
VSTVLEQLTNVLQALLNVNSLFAMVIVQEVKFYSETVNAGSSHHTAEEQSSPSK